MGKILVELGYVTERQIAEALSQQLTLPLVDCDHYEITEEVKALVPKEIAEKKIIMPLEVKAKPLWLTMADPLDWETMGEIGFMTGLNVNNVIACETNLLGAIEKHYGAEEKVWDFLKNMPGFENVEFKKEAPEEEGSLQSFEMNSETPAIIKLVTMTIVDAVKSKSPTHVSPFIEIYRPSKIITGGRDVLSVTTRAITGRLASLNS